MALFRPATWSGLLVSAGIALSAMTGTAEAQTLTIAQGNDILSLDPANHGNNSTESALVNIYDYLVDKDFSQGQLRFTPRLARSWSTDDNSRWTFKLRDDVFWHNGERFTAQDVKFTIERSQQDRKLLSSSKFRRIKSVEAPDDTTVVIETDGPDTLLLHYFVGNGAGILPKAAFEKAASREEFFRKPVGTGPYVFDQWVKSDRLVLRRNPRWWGGTPKWEKVVIRSIPETTTRVAELLTGGVDIAVNIPPEDIARVSDNKGTRAISFDIARNIALHVRTGKDRVTGDQKVREAIDLAIDRDAIVSQVLEGHGKPTRGFFPPAIPGFAPDLNTNIRFDPERAKALLKEAGFDGRKRPAVKISTPSGRYVKDREMVEAVAGYLEDAGFRVQVEVLDWTVYNNKLVGDGFGEIYLWGMGSYTDASSLFVHDFKRHYDWSNPAFEELSVKIGSAKTEAERIAISQHAQKIVADQRVRIGLLLPQSIYGVSDRVVYNGRFDEMIAAEDVGRP